MNQKLTKTVFTALFMALCCAGTFIHVPSPGTTGYLNLGDCFVVLSGWLLGPVYGFLAGGIGSAISDLVLSYASYAPATLVIKGCMALVAHFIYKALIKVFKNKFAFPCIISAFAAEIIMIGGYYLYESLLMSNFASSLAGIAGNSVQGLFGIIVSVIIMGVLEKTGLKNTFLKNIRQKH